MFKVKEEDIYNETVSNQFYKFIVKQNIKMINHFRKKIEKEEFQKLIKKIDLYGIEYVTQKDFEESLLYEGIIKSDLNSYILKYKVDQKLLKNKNLNYDVLINIKMDNGRIIDCNSSLVKR